MAKRFSPALHLRNSTCKYAQLCQVYNSDMIDCLFQARRSFIADLGEPLRYPKALGTSTRPCPLKSLIVQVVAFAFLLVHDRALHNQKQLSVHNHVNHLNWSMLWLNSGNDEAGVEEGVDSACMTTPDPLVLSEYRYMRSNLNHLTGNTAKAHTEFEVGWNWQCVICLGSIR